SVPPANAWSPSLKHVSVAVALGFLVVTLVALSARADRVALLPSRGSADDAARTALDADLPRALFGLKHVAAPAADVDRALKGIADGVADTPDEYRAVGAATKTDWVVVGSIDPPAASSSSARVELTACLVSTGRIESVARDIDKGRSVVELGEMLGVLLRP